MLLTTTDPAAEDFDTARILKVVNSAFYGLPGQIASVERAIVLLGLVYAWRKGVLNWTR